MTVQTTTDQLSVGEWVEATEADKAPKAAALAAALTGVRDTLPALEDAAERAELDANEMRSQVRDVNAPTPTPAKWNVALARVDITREALAGAREAEKHLAGRQVATDARIGVPIAHALGVHYGIPAAATWLKPDPRAPLSAPCVLVSVLNTEQAADGMFTGTVEALLYRTPIYRALDGQVVAKALKAADVPFSFAANDGVRSVAVGNGREVDRMQLRINGMALGTPVIPNVSPNAPHNLAHVFAIDLATELGLPLIAGGHDGSFVFGARGKVLAGIVVDAETTSDDIKGDVRHATVRATLYFEGIGGLPLPLVRSAAERVRDDWARSTLAGFGEVVDVSVTGERDEPASTRLHGAIHGSEAWRKAEQSPTNYKPGWENVAALTLTVTAKSLTREVTK